MIMRIDLRDVSEHDMDMLIIEEFICNEFVRDLFYIKINNRSKTTPNIPINNLIISILHIEAFFS